jgi:C_GCAxxG_C_C family probable redox protein
MQEKINLALQYFGSNYNCAQSVFISLSQELGVPHNDALALTAGFGGGVAGTRQICGAVAGAVMAIGLKHFDNKEDITISKEHTKIIVQIFLNNFIEKFGSTTCKDLLLPDNEVVELSDEEASLKKHQYCERYVAEAVALATKLADEMS